MDNANHVTARVRDFSVAFQQMCSIVAIGQTKNPQETLRELIVQVLVLYPEKKISGMQDLEKILESKFGLRTPDHEVSFAIDRLLSDRIIIKNNKCEFVLDEKLADFLKKDIKEAQELETRIKNDWAEDLKVNYTSLEFNTCWACLRDYLSEAFLRHGIQAASLLNPSIQLDDIYSQSLTELLSIAVSQVPSEQQTDVKQVVSYFIATAGEYPDRTKYISQLADGAFSYFSLATSPKVAKQFRENLSSLLIYLDTNFLFGLLELSVNPQEIVSTELINVIQKNQLPFSLKIHPKTQIELDDTIASYEYSFSKRNWSRNISKIAISSNFVSGVERKYHQVFYETGIDVHSFFLPFQHTDILLKEKQIEMDKSVYVSAPISEEVATLILDYKEYLETKGKSKEYEALEHDMTVLSHVRKLRSQKRSSLEAGALLLTCDYFLFSFDWEISRKINKKPCTVLPNLFWQILRPFIPSDENFDKSFAETFAVPEFRIINNGAAQAASKMFSLMAAYSDFPEDTAMSLLTNDVLLEQLQRAETDEDFQKFVETAIISENSQLTEENAALSDLVNKERNKIKSVDQKAKNLEEDNKKKDKRLEEELQKRTLAEQKAKEEEEKRILIEQKLMEDQKKQEKEKFKDGIVKTILLSGFMIVLFETLINRLNWSWLLQHPSSYGLRLCAYLLFIGCSLIAFVPKWRIGALIGLVAQFIGIVAQIIGGPR